MRRNQVQDWVLLLEITHQRSHRPRYSGNHTGLQENSLPHDLAPPGLGSKTQQDSLSTDTLKIKMNLFSASFQIPRVSPHGSLFHRLPAEALFHENTQKSGLPSYPEGQDMLTSGILTTSTEQQNFKSQSRDPPE